MSRWCSRSAAWLTVFVACSAAFLAAQTGGVQTGGADRVFPQDKAAVEKALKTLQSSIAGRLPVLEGFAQSTDHPLDRYERGYYHTTVKVMAEPSGGARVQVSAKITAWYKDPAGVHSGYQLLNSIGRIESDLMDQLSEQLTKGATATEKTSFSDAASTPTKTFPPAGSWPAAPSAKTTESPGLFSSSRSQSLAAKELALTRPMEKSSAPDAAESSLRAEAQDLEEILKNQAHPKNLVAVRKSGTPVVATPSLTAKPLFLASMHDEFEMLDFNADWVHVRVSGLSRGWIWRNSLEMPEGIPDTGPAAASQAPAADLFHVVREETAPFPGDWEPLRGKNVKIVTVQKTGDDAKQGGSKERLSYIKYLLETNYKQMAGKPDQAGIVVIFDSSDGGMIAAPLATLQQWKAGALSDAALWHKCFFDPPETLDSESATQSR
ncbi:MAG TPA: hypothetical protein VMH04_11860 [Candidatus Solibacter sp.]|nr:hypothetical protein [Candidatus Solibacter sp.]